MASKQMSLNTNFPIFGNLLIALIAMLHEILDLCTCLLQFWQELKTEIAVVSIPNLSNQPTTPHQNPQ